MGGVHRGGETCKSAVLPLVHYHSRSTAAMDISADLHELARCPVGLVSAGVKSILDIGRCVMQHMILYPLLYRL